MCCCSALAEVLKYERCSIVQEAAIPVCLNAVDVIAKAKTGTGKTLAFIIPAIEKVRLPHCSHCCSTLRYHWCNDGAFLVPDPIWTTFHSPAFYRTDSQPMSSIQAMKHLTEGGQHSR